MLIIKTTSELKDVVDILSKEEAIAIDTEFVRIDTYFAKLALIQIATKKDFYVIDPLELDLTPFARILTDKNIVKVLHAPSQDVGIFYHKLGAYTANLFDTQEAAKYCGIKHQISYQDICQKVLGITIEKEQQFRNWLIRPLSKELIDYALQDVAYLLQLYQKLKSEMRAYHSVEKFASSMEIYNQKEFYLPKIENIWKKIKTLDKFKDSENRLQMLAAFRELAAIKLDLPRQHVINDNGLILIAQKLPKDSKDLAKLSIRHKLSAEQLEELFDICAGLEEMN